MPRWLDELHDDLAKLEADHLRRQLVGVDRGGDVGDALPSARLIQRDGRTLLNFASNDYLALCDHPHLKQAAIDATQRWGTGAGASRLVTGHLTIHAEIERRFAAFKHAQAALLCATGYLANLAVLTTLAGPGDLVCVDKLCHASLLDAAAASGATVRVFPHLQLGKLKRLLEGPLRQTEGNNQKCSNSPPSQGGAGGGFDPRNDLPSISAMNSTLPQPLPKREGSSEKAKATRAPRKFIVTDSIFSMDGDAANLPALCDLAAENEAILIVDEAHGTGLLGNSGAGLCEAQGVADRVDIVISTASKALGGLGGIVTAKQVVIDSLINHARSFIYTTAIPASQAATIGAALDVVRDEPWRRKRVLELASRVQDMLRSSAFAVASSSAVPPVSPIIPIITGSAASALALAAHLASHGIHAPAIRPPTVAPNGARVRLSLRADLTDQDMECLQKAISQTGDRRQETGDSQSHGGR